MLRDLGITQSVMVEQDGLAFAVRRYEVDYLSPAKLDDELEVRSTLRALGAARLDLDQAIYRRAGAEGAAEQELCRLVIRLAVINRAGRPTRLPPKIVALMAPLTVARAAAQSAVESQPLRSHLSIRATANKKRA